MRRSSIGRLTVVIAAVAIIIGGYIGSVRMIRPSRETDGPPDCEWMVRNVLLAVLGYANSTGAFPTGVWPNPSLPPEKRLSWYGAILPYLDQKEPWEALDKGRPWDDPANERITKMHIGGFRCPDAAPAPASGPSPTHYIGIAGLGTDSPFLPKGHPRAGVFGYERRTTLADITNGASSTMIVAESARIARVVACRRTGDRPGPRYLRVALHRPRVPVRWRPSGRHERRVRGWLGPLRE